MIYVYIYNIERERVCVCIYIYIEIYGNPLPDTSLRVSRSCEAVLREGVPHAVILKSIPTKEPRLWGG